MKLLRALEAGLVRVEGGVAVALVLLMLALAGYNVVYRNVLVPLQKHWAHSGPIPEAPPPPPGSFAANMVSFIDAIKLAWIDVVLRQLVILVAFFGAMMATQRGKHINVDALSKLLSPARRRWLSVATNLLATGVCLVFAKAGSALVGIGREHPHELVPWADEWVFQLMFPLCFGLLAFHFAVRVAEAATGTSPEQPTGGVA